jgi:beta-lactamase regulating signal transducer with metallopeptidase domain
MNAILDGVALWLADFHLVATALLLGVLAALAAMRQPARRMAVVKATLGSLATLTLLCALPGWSVIHLMTDTAPQVKSLRFDRSLVVPEEPSATQLIPTVNVDRISPERPAGRVNVAPRKAVEPQNVSRWVDWLPLAALVHAMGSAAVVLWLIVGAILAGRIHRGATAAPVSMQRLLAGVVGSESAPELLVSAEIATPVALGVRQAAIILPTGMSDDDGDEPLVAVLAHEWAHVQNGDLRTLAASRLLLVLLWPQPFYWLLRRGLRLDQEALADAAAAEVAGRVEYAERLVGWARHQDHGHKAPRLAGAVGLWEGPSQLKRRIALLLDEKFSVMRSCSRRWRGACFAAMGLTAVGLSLVTFQPATRAADEEVAAKPPAATNEKTPTEGQQRLAKLFRQLGREPNVVAGYAVDENGEPLAGVDVELYRYESGSFVEGPPALATKSDAKGFFRLENVVEVASEFPAGLPEDNFLEPPIKTTAIVGRAPGRATFWTNEFTHHLLSRGRTVVAVMKPAALLHGRVVDSDGQPVAGAIVTAGLGGVVLGTNAARTDADGRYAIDDLAAYDAKAEERRIKEMKKQNPEAMATAFSLPPQMVSVRHPAFATKRVTLDSIPGNVDVRLSPGAVIEGRVVYRNGDAPDALRPAAGVPVTIDRLTSPALRTGVHLALVESETTKTDAEGRYRFASLPEGRYGVTALATDWVTNGVSDITATAGLVTQAPDVTMTRGAVVRVILVDAATNKPVTFEKPTKGYVLSRLITNGISVSNRRSPITTFSKNGVGETRVAPGKFNFFATVPDNDPIRGADWTSVDIEKMGAGREFDAVEGQTVEVTLPMRKLTRPTTATGTIVPAAAPSDEDAKEDQTSLQPSGSLDFKIEAAPAEATPLPAGGKADGSTVIFAPASISPGSSPVGADGGGKVELDYGPAIDNGAFSPKSPAEQEDAKDEKPSSGSSGGLEAKVWASKTAFNSSGGWWLVRSAAADADAGLATLGAEVADVDFAAPLDYGVNLRVTAHPAPAVDRPRRISMPLSAP